MQPVRRFVSALAALLVAIVFVQATDLVACADEPAAHAGTTQHDSAPAHDAPAADCYCHVVFAPTAVVSAVVSEPEGARAAFAVFVASPLEIDLKGPDPVPLA